PHPKQTRQNNTRSQTTTNQAQGKKIVHTTALTFKHAVEFSKFGHTPRGHNLLQSALGRLDQQ
ncbi:MAG TPA: hypothetical protein VFP89_11280, partial [Propionibacteriaceae bacterium]|nr:hypothetical protein [Propionibacteriaceae bacterium]